MKAESHPVDLHPKSGRYVLRFRFAGREFKCSLKTTDSREAFAGQAWFEETQRLVERGLLTVPPDGEKNEWNHRISKKATR